MSKKLITKDGQRSMTSRNVTQVKFLPASSAELKAIGEDLPEGYIAGWASTPQMDRVGDVIAPGAFDESIKAKGISGPRGIKLLAQHEMDKPAGVIKVLETRGGALWIEAQMNLKISYVRDLYEAAKINDGLSFSVGFMLVEDGFSWEKDADGELFFSITKADLHEISIVTLPCNDGAEMVFMKGQADAPRKFSTAAEFEKALVVSGFAKSRNGAHDLVTLIKANVNLFSPEAPVLASTKALDDISKTLKRLNNLLPSA